MNNLSYNLILDPYFHPLLIGAVFTVGFLLLFYKAFVQKNKKGTFLRLLSLILFAVILLNPLILDQEKKKKNDVVVVIEDTSASNTINDRAKQTAETQERILSELAKLKDIDIRQIKISSDKTNTTEIFDAWRESVSDIPYEQIGATILISDGLIHDVPKNLEPLDKAGPFHTILTGKPDEKDRLIKVHNAPTYGLVNETVSIEVEVQDIDKPLSPLAPLTIKLNNEVVYEDAVKPNEKISFDIDISRAGTNIIEVSTPFVEKKELTPLNNKTIISINGVRDRLKVLLVSGLPHNGERLWRNILKSDPNIDLVHFTILRSVEKTDATPDNELALIPFPIDELFMRKINDFDLIIFDRFARFGTIPQNYIDNIAKYIEKGGAFLDVLGPNVLNNTVFKTKLDELLPAKPLSDFSEQEFFPQVSDVGLRHPITQNLFDKKPNSAFPWYRQMRLNVTEGDVIMEGLNKAPLLVVSDASKGRVAQMASDQIWLWARGHKAANSDDVSNNSVGPYLPLLRRLGHWLMKEPELETERVEAKVKGQTIEVNVYSLYVGKQTLKIQNPDGTEETREIDIDKSGVASLSIKAEDFGVYHLSNEKASTVAIVGSLNDKEYQNLLSTGDLIKPVVNHTRGEIVRLQNVNDLSIRKSTSALSFGGRNWVAVKDREQYEILSSKQTTLISPLLGIILLATLLIAGWFKENK